jgi:uncharacterized SAM-binding protein YcdF (DUF218 family)
MFIIGKIVAALILPPGIFVIVAALVAILAARGKKKAAWILSAADALAIYVLSTCAFSNMLVIPLENKYVPLTWKVDATAVVVLGGGFNDTSPEYGNAGALTSTSEKRAIYGLELANRYGLPLVFSGGKVFSLKKEGSEAEAAGRLWLSLGVDRNRIMLETESKDTKENASRVAALKGKGPFILVTSAFHMPRAMRTFEKAGINVIAAPTDFQGKRSPILWSDLMPDSGQLSLSRLALHEYFGMIYYNLTL